MQANAITFHGKTLTEGAQNFFKLCCGVLPSFGFFRAPKSLVDYVLDDKKGEAGKLVFTSGDTKITLHRIYLVKSIEIDAIDPQVCDIVLADERILWQYIFGDEDFNTYPTDRTKGRDLEAGYCFEGYTGGEQDFSLENRNGDEPDSEPWKFNELVAKIASLLGINLTMNTLDYGDPIDTPKRRPRNILGKNISAATILQQLLLGLHAFLTIDPTIEEGSKFVIHPIGVKEKDDDTKPLRDNSAFLYKSKETRINPKLQQGFTAELLTAADPEENDGRLLTHGSHENTVGTGTGRFLSVSPYAVFEAGANEDFLGKIGDEVGEEYHGSFQNTWRDETYSAILPLCLGRAIHEIVWVSTIKGAFTHVRSFRPRPVLPAFTDTLFAYHKYLLAGGGGAGVTWAKIIQGLQYADETNEQCPEGIDKYYAILQSQSPAVFVLGTHYAVGDLILYTPDEGCPIKRMYKCLEEHTATSFIVANWEAADMELGAIATEGDPNLPADPRHYLPWFLIDEIVPVIKRSDEWYIKQTLTYCGEPIEKSLTWNEDEKRAMSVYRGTAE